MTTTVGQALERAEDPSPRQLVAQYSDSFAAVLPTHLRLETWVRIAQGALKRGTRLPSGQYELEAAANNNPGLFLATLLDAARLGLEPGTEQYYLTPRKVKGKVEILGIVGYQGIIELMYRAGAVASVVAEVVYSNDGFTYRPGVDDIPLHEIDWDSEDRGALRLVYAFARMKDGATSKVVVMNRSDIAKVKASSQGSGSEYSPWQKHPESMWRKSAVRQLAKWVPTSSEYRTSAGAVTPSIASAVTDAGFATPSVDIPDVPHDPETGELLYDERPFDDDEPVDAEIVA